MPKIYDRSAVGLPANDDTLSDQQARPIGLRGARHEVIDDSYFSQAKKHFWKLSPSYSRVSAAVRSVLSVTDEMLRDIWSLVETGSVGINADQGEENSRKNEVDKAPEKPDGTVTSHKLRANKAVRFQEPSCSESQAFTVEVDKQNIPVALTGMFCGNHCYRVSRALEKELVPTLTTAFETLKIDQLTDSNIYRALRQAMSALNESCVDLGTTACVNMIIDGKRWIANMGDHRVLIANNDGSCLELSTDDKVIDLIDKKKVNECIWVPRLRCREWRTIKEKNIVISEKATFYRDYVFKDSESVQKTVDKIIKSGGEIHLSVKCKQTGRNGCLEEWYVDPTATIIAHKVNPQMQWLIDGGKGIFNKLSANQLTERIRTETETNPGITGQDMANAIVKHAYNFGSKDDVIALAIPVQTMLRKAEPNKIP